MSGVPELPLGLRLLVQLLKPLRFLSGDLRALERNAALTSLNAARESEGSFASLHPRVRHTLDLGNLSFPRMVAFNTGLATAGTARKPSASAIGRGPDVKIKG